MVITDFVPVPEWPGEDNVDGGIAVGDLDGDGTPELVVYVIDSLPGDNAGRYRVGRGFDAAGAPTGGWGPWQQLPTGRSWRTPAVATLADLDGGGDGVLDLVVLAVDNPIGSNAGFHRVLNVVTDLDTAQAEGVWRLLEVDSGVLAVHAALLPTGRQPTRTTLACRPGQSRVIGAGGS